MDEPNFAVFKYDHADPLVKSWWVWALFWTVLALLGASILFLGPGGIVLAVIAVIASFMAWPKRRITVGMRYFVCGNTVAYYKNIRKMVLRPGHLTLFWGNQQSFRLEETRFPTNARKPHKINANKMAKFQKVSRKIVERVLAESPGVELLGEDRRGEAKAAR